MRVPVTLDTRTSDIIVIKKEATSQTCSSSLMIILLIVLCTTEEGKSNISANVYKLQIKTTNKDELTEEHHIQIYHCIDDNGLTTRDINEPCYT